MTVSLCGRQPHVRTISDMDKVAATLAVLSVVLASCGGAPTPVAASPSVVAPTARAVVQSSATPLGFVLPPTCSYIGAPSVGPDLSQWKFDCGTTANRDARGALGPSFARQGWTSCGAVTATATWINGPVRLVVSEGSGSAGEAGLPTLGQTSRTPGPVCP